MQKNTSKSQLSPFSALKASPMRNLRPPSTTKKEATPANDQEKKISPRVTRSKMGIIKPTKMYDSEFERSWDNERRKAASTTKEKPAFKEFTNKKYNRRTSKIVRGPTRVPVLPGRDYNSQPNERPTTSRASDATVSNRDYNSQPKERPTTTSRASDAMKNFRFSLGSSSSSPKKDPKSSAASTNAPNNSRHWLKQESIFTQGGGSTSMFSRGGTTYQKSIFPQTNKAVPPVSFNCDIPEFDATKPPPPLPPSSSTTINNNSLPTVNFTFNLPPPKCPEPEEQSFFQSTQLSEADPELSVPSPDDHQVDVNKIVTDFLVKHGHGGTKKRRESSNKCPDDTQMDIDEEEPKITIELAQAILQQCLVKIEQISQLRRLMEKSVDLIPDYEWQIKSQRLGIYRADILETLTPLLSNSAIESLKEKLKKKQAKRAWVHKRNNELRSEKQLMKERRSRMKSFIDEWHQKLEMMEKEGRDRELEKKAAKELLEDVTRRIKETQRYIAVFGRLRELSLARLVANGENDEKMGEDFRKRIGELQDLWEDLLLEYQEEKIALDTIYDRRTSDTPLPPQPKSLESQWLEVIFGRASIYDQNNPFLIAERDVSNFIAIRREWDSYINPNSKNSNLRIPNFWTLPSRNATSMWRQYRRKGNVENDKSARN
ncbi:uncharacterized protein LOC129797507 [Lutzomyia longipalpis]|uniref:uncharacterized protein LOC129797507 n=1 Tax=Lutzomyia longipalpis TaxID=7200 RepID=UPI002483306B|nr:uncharacterized protein LOC129797507 [Lutzomyia longipalpis]